MRLLSLFILYFILFSYPIAIAQEKDDEPAQEQESEASEEESEPASNSTSGIIIIDRAKIDIAPPPNFEQQRANDLKHFLINEELQPLLVGPNELITILAEQTTGNEKGVAILLPDWQKSIISPKAINNLRNELPDHGWTTISMQPLVKPEAYPSTKTDIDEQTKENEEILKEYKLLLSSNIEAVLEKALNYSGKIMLIAEGANAALFTDIVNESKKARDRKFRKLDAMVILSGYMPTENDNKAFALALALSKLPILDVYLSKDALWVSTNSDRRQKLSKKHAKAFYRQRMLNNTVPGYYPNKNLIRTIAGWIITIDD